MKQIKLILLTGLLLTGSHITLFAQQVLPEFVVLARNYKYLSSVDGDVGQPVRLLRQQAVSYDIKNSEIYQEDYDTYSISFYLPGGYILAAYDSKGALISTAEKYKNVALPEAITTAVAERYPNWGIANDTYLVNYKDGRATRILYKLVLQNGDKRLRVKLNPNGDFLD
ncbi:hypothetical protein SAMN05428949_0538 [Chitinophaga sp. YR627]|uniref:nicotinate-nucleotide adenylyltransferase n=1 Tax=Chitinophaga sp. YR627 TaxID=1881041 RepID=UPI0008F38C33|nr:nicotinate-nucleotide adenylyltransferase [Chitinophaga sp. YR627]SFM71489.1 hypothetical protein SAMN05428949_0538 [Chitinophaga sp. YR627]